MLQVCWMISNGFLSLWKWLQRITKISQNTFTEIEDTYNHILLHQGEHEFSPHHIMKAINLTVPFVYLGTRYVHPVSRQIFRNIVIRNWQY